ncbi:MAG: hypothetical protein V4514_00425 [Pseudomonadota bacterium]|uniref:hypothetical protein n=1 Tax=unclassified Phenylobacterium TaxID=2640670 RepID=UPI0006FD6FA3|nr:MULTISPECIES: hypothetical protein [unclassified Phenylobacterium]KRB44684.1 hypothetical protein ASE02_03390 [Phenylobacterium sp. Root700]MBT9472186.1 hypothetical protein [Phenylobacterium sp.]
MPHRDHHPEDPRDERRWREAEARDERRADHGPRSFGEEGRYSSDQARYYGADARSYGPSPSHRAHLERPPWRRARFEANGSEPAPALPADYEDALTRGYYSLEGPHGGQEYGIEAHGYRESLPSQHQRRQRHRHPPSGYEDAPYGDQPLDRRDPGIREFGPPADYAYHPHANTEFDPEYLTWREEQLHGHDRDYAFWRAEQHQKYDAEYRIFRSQRQDEFGRSFADWRTQRDAQNPLNAPASEGQAPPEDKV